MTQKNRDVAVRPLNLTNPNQPYDVECLHTYWNMSYELRVFDSHKQDINSSTQQAVDTEFHQIPAVPQAIQPNRRGVYGGNESRVEHIF
jgi:hypothetical protein